MAVGCILTIGFIAALVLCVLSLAKRDITYFAYAGACAALATNLCKLLT